MTIFEKLKEMCKENTTCRACPFGDNPDNCLLGANPVLWETDKINKAVEEIEKVEEEDVF